MSDNDKPVIPQSDLPATPMTDDEFKQKMQEGLKGFDLGNAFENAIKALQKHGIKGFIENPKAVIAEAALGMAKDGKLQLNQNTNQNKELSDGNTDSGT